MTVTGPRGYEILASSSLHTDSQQSPMHHLTQTSSTSLRRAAAHTTTKPSLARNTHKEIKFSNEGRAAILKGVDILAKAVSVTLGPKGGLLAST